MQDDTRCVTKSAVSLEGYDSLTVPVHRASTIRYADAASFVARFERGSDGYVYGLYGTPTHRFLEYKITELERGIRTVLAPSGQAAIAMTMVALLRAGDKVLIPDAVYSPVRDFSTNELQALGVEAVFYDPLDLDGLRAQIDDRTRLVWVESPGSITMEVQDVAAIAAMAHQKGALVGCDNTWASPIYFRPLEHGADLVVEALSKHFGGHSDVLMGSVTVKDDSLGYRLKAAFGRLGIGVSPDDCALVTRGIETLAVRLERSGRSAAAVIDWLVSQPLIDSVLYPALPGSPGHAIWKRDFAGACGVFSFSVRRDAEPFVFPALDALKLISIGASWGGTKSLIAPSSVKGARTARPWSGADYFLRLNVGLENAADIIEDLQRFATALTSSVSNARKTA